MTSLTGGRTTAECRTWYPNASEIITGFFGRSGGELDKVGPIFYRVGSPAPGRQVCFYKDTGFMGEHRCYGVGDYGGFTQAWVKPPPERPCSSQASVAPRPAFAC